MSELNLYQRLGGENVVNVLVENVYDKIRDDYRVSRFFNDTDQKNQIQTLNVVVSTALNGNFNTNEFIKSVSDFFMSAFAKFKDKEVGEPLKNTPAVAEAPAPAKSKTLMYVGIVAGGIVVTYLLLKFSKKE